MGPKTLFQLLRTHIAYTTARAHMLAWTHTCACCLLTHFAPELTGRSTSKSWSWKLPSGLAWSKLFGLFCGWSKPCWQPQQQVAGSRRPIFPMIWTPQRRMRTKSFAKGSFAPEPETCPGAVALCARHGAQTCAQIQSLHGPLCAVAGVMLVGVLPLTAFSHFRLHSTHWYLSLLLRTQFHMIAPKAAGAAIPNDNESCIYKYTSNISCFQWLSELYIIPSS